MYETADKSYVTNDMSFAAYLVVMHEFKLVKAEKLGRTYRFELFPEGKNGNSSANVEKLKLEYMNSVIAKFDSTIRNIKRIVFGDGV